MVEATSADKPRFNNRMLVIGGGMVVGLLFLMLIPSVVQSSESQQVLEGWQILVSEDFESGLGPDSNAVDSSTTDGGDYTWGPVNVVSSSPMTSAWAVGGGTDGENLVTSGTYTYPQNVDSWLIYGPLTVTNVFEAELLFDWWLDSAPGDWFSWCFTDNVDEINDETCDSAKIAGSFSNWISGTATLDYTGDDLYVAFHFTSNDDGEAGMGAFVDNVRVRVDYGQLLMLPLIRRDPTPTPTPTPTPAALYYYDGFNNASSGWTTHSASCCFSAGFCDEPRQNLDYKYDLYYSGGQYHTYIPVSCLEGGQHGWTRHIFPLSFAPGVIRPVERTCIEMAGNFENLNTHASRFGLVFAASADMSTEYSVVVDDRADWAILRSTGYEFPGPNDSSSLDQEQIVSWIGGSHSPAKPAMQTNVLRAEIAGDQVKVYINGVHVYTFARGDISDLRYVGIIGGSWEWGDTRIGYDYFLVDEGCDGP